MTSKEKHIEKWQWWLLGAWLLFIAVVGFIVLFRLSSIRTAAPPPLPAASTEFKLGDGPEIEIRGRVLLPDGSPAPKGASISISNITYAGLGVGSVLTDEGGYYSAKANVGAKFTAYARRQYPDMSYVFPALATTVVEHPEPGRYDIHADDNPVRVYGRFRNPDGSPASGSRMLMAQALVFGRAPVLLARNTAGNVYEEEVKWTYATITCDDGRYEIFLPPGEYAIEADGRLYEKAPCEDVTLLAGDADREIDFTVRPASRFRFVLPDGMKPREKEMNMYAVAVSDSSTYHNQQIARDPNGDFDVVFTRNGTHIIVEADTESGPYGIALLFLGVEKLEPMTVMLQTASKAKIRLVDEKDGVPLAGLECYFSARFPKYDGPALRDRVQGSRLGMRVVTDENGVAVLEPLYVGGEYEISLRNNFQLWPMFRVVEGGKLYDLGDWKVSGNFAAYKKPDTPEENVTEIRTPDPAGEQGHDE